ncbi:MAG: tetratricopeptide repeat protein [Gemmatimonadota bacterium]
MKAPHRSALQAVGLAAALVATVVPSVAGAQRNRQGPGPETKRVLVTTFRGDPAFGIQAADEIRNRIEGEYSIRTLMPNPKKDIDATLMQSGYRPDSALSPNDIKELAKLVHADEVIDGSINKIATGFHASVRMFLPRDVSLSQPIFDGDVKDMGELAKKVVDEYDRARKTIPDNQACENGIRANTPAVAIAAARKGMISYPKSTLLRLCMASAYSAMKATADSTGPWKDSVIAVSKSILDLDKGSRIAFNLMYDAYNLKKDTANALQALIGMMNADPTNQTLREQVIATLVTSGKAEIAVPTAKQLVADNPGDPQYAKTYWYVLRAAKMFKEAVPAGVAYVSIDTTAADSGYFDRQISDLEADSLFAKAAEFGALAVKKYPANTRYLMQKGNHERKAGQLPAAKASFEAALRIDPKVNFANYLLAQISLDQGNFDDAVKYAHADAAQDPANKSRAVAVLVSVGRKLYEAGNTSHQPDDFRKALPVLTAAEEMSPTPLAKFLLGVSAYQILSGTQTALQASKSCDDFKAANDLVTMININMPAGGAIDRGTATSVLQWATQFGPFVDGSIKKFCK